MTDPAENGDRFRRRRERLLEEIGGGVALIAARPPIHKSRDTDLRYRPDSDLFYLTGFGEAAAVAVLTPHDPEHRFTLFVRPRDPEREAWDGPRAGVDGAKERFGADAAYPVAELEERLTELLRPADAVWYALGSRADLDSTVLDHVRRFRMGRARTGRGPLDVRDPARPLERMRLVKDEHELERMREAARVSAAGHRAAMRACRPGMGEWELEAEVDAVFRRLGGSGSAYETIVGSGPNATTLHHVSNDRRIRDGDLVLIDAGAEVGMYAGDITRTFPANGRFTAPQRRVYDIVLRALDAAVEAVRSGAPIGGVHDAAVRVLTQGMVELGLLEAGEGGIDALIEEGAHRRFYLHQTSHWLGLDVHDAGPYAEPDGASLTLQPGMVLTVEPGLYVPAGAEDVPEELRGIGVRIEDDVAVTEEGCENLTRPHVPVDPEAVERLVGRTE